RRVPGRGPPGRRRRLGARSPDRLDAAGEEAPRRPARAADAARAGGPRAHGDRELEPGHRRRARDHAARSREVRLDDLHEARAAVDSERVAAGPCGADVPALLTPSATSPAAARSRTRPAPIAPQATVDRIGTSAPALTRASTPREPSAFITTIDHE